MAKTATFFICVLYFWSCKQQSVTDQLSLRDSALNVYLVDIDSTVGFDTTDGVFQMLQAYHRNDASYLSNFLKQHDEAIAYSKREDVKQYEVYPDSCVHFDRLDKSAYEEAYRFTYKQAFCPLAINVTVTRANDTLLLVFLLYKPGRDWDSSGCKIIRQFTHLLTQKNWDQVHEAMMYADFWGLKRHNDVRGTDGSTLRVEGYLNEHLKAPRPPRYHVVSRWLGKRPAIFDAFALVMKLSGNKEGCFYAD